MRGVARESGPERQRPWVEGVGAELVLPPSRDPPSEPDCRHRHGEDRQPTPLHHHPDPGGITRDERAGERGSPKVGPPFLSSDERTHGAGGLGCVRSPVPGRSTSLQRVAEESGFVLGGPLANGSPARVRRLTHTGCGRALHGPSGTIPVLLSRCCLTPELESRSEADRAV